VGYSAAAAVKCFDAMKADPKTDRTLALRGYALAIVITHLGLTVAHGLAHSHLAIALTVAQKLFVALVIVSAPLLAGYFIWRYRLRLGSTLLTISMAGALIFGIYYHFIAAGPDNVDYDHSEAPAKWHNLFEDTAIDVTLIEALGLFAGAALFMKSRGQNENAETSGPSATGDPKTSV
jgi:hypothetical protein